MSFLVTIAYDVFTSAGCQYPCPFTGPNCAFDIMQLCRRIGDEQFRADQSMLADRFKFAMHRETRDISVNTAASADS